ncbi:MAG: hypothetical protein Q8918_18380 [Bacteroidota bacterium]|nr:hypothetical protein [Bacteroidota bacterium]MDP4213077.1 hypothetical protein [Bacteroidota bacterium]MDP4252072.1 hypothetical protein [Bacteroidota bacterium]
MESVPCPSHILAYTRMIGEELFIQDSVQEIEHSEATPVTRRRVKLVWTGNSLPQSRLYNFSRQFKSGAQQVY